MKADRCLKSSSAATRTAAAVVLTGLLFAAAHPAAGQFTLRSGTVIIKSSSKEMAVALARGVGEVRKRFDKNRRALRSVRGPNGKQAYPQKEVTGLIARTGEDLDRAIEQVGEPGLDALRAWAAEELRRIQGELAASPDQTVALSSGSTPRAIALVASLEGLPLPRLASVSASSPEGTISAEKSNRLLDQVGEMVSRIFVLAKKGDLEVELWVGSTPVPRATFRFWSQGQIKGSPPAHTIIQTNGKPTRVLRGLYSYRAIVGEGAVAELIQYPNPSGAPEAQLPSERLDLVKESRFFCCEFNEQYCRHVSAKKECRP